MAEIEIGNLKLVNVTRTLTPATEDTFRFTVPPGGVGLMKESTYHLRRASALASAGEGGSFWTSEDVIIKSLEVMKQGASERTNLLSGNCNIKEFGGDGKMANLFPVVETLENNEDVLILVRNDDTANVRISITLRFAVKPRERRIAGQAPSPEEAKVPTV